MACGYCYNPERVAEDMSLEDFKRLCSTLPSPILMKLSGGEPTLHPQLGEFIKIAYSYGHLVYIISNGLRYRDPEFLDSLIQVKDSGANFSSGLSMDGGYSNSKAYEIINGGDYLQAKLEAFQALVDSSLTRVCLTAVIVRGLNEDVMPQLVELALKNPKTVRYIHIRNAGNVGRFEQTKSYDIHDLKRMARNLFTEEQFKEGCVGELHCPPESGRDCCYRFRPTPRLQISLLEFFSKKAAHCPKRGRVKVGSDKIEPLFFSMGQPDHQVETSAEIG